MKLVLPMAGDGSRFRSHSDLPKYLIPVSGVPMLQSGVKGMFFAPRDIVAIVRRDHCEKYDALAQIRKILGEEVQIVIVERTKGTTETVFLGLEQTDIALDESICIKDADCIAVPEKGWKEKIEKDSQGKDKIWLGTYSDGGSLTGGATNKSHVLLDIKGRVLEVREKVRLSPFFIAGHYIFSSVALFNKTAKVLFKSWEENKKTPETYLACTVDSFLESGGYVENLSIQEYADLGTPEALETYVRQS